MASFDWLTRRRQREHDLQEEIRAHLAMAAQERIADGADQETARLGALKEFGNVTLTTEAAHRVWHPWWLEPARDLFADVRYAVRLLAKTPGFSLVVIAVLALGIGLNAAVFTMFKGLALRPLSGVDGSGSLGVVLATTSAGRLMSLSYPDYRYLRERDRAFAGLAGSSLSFASLGRGKDAQRVAAEFVTGNYFGVLGVRTHLGRPLLPSDELAPGKHPVVVLSDGLWRRAFGADPGIVGKTVQINSYPMTVVGVADPAFHGTIVSFDIELFVPIMMVPQIGLAFQAFPRDLLHDQVPIVMVLGRLAPDSTLTTAAAQIAVLSAQLAAEAPLKDISQRLMVLPIWRSPYGAQTYLLPAMVVIGATGVLLLLIVCANIAGLVLVRGITRRGEIAVRLALGASRTRVLRLLLIENMVLAVPGALFGVLIVWRAIPLMMAASNASGAPIRLFFDMSIDGLVIGFAVLASCASALVFGFVPALRSSRVDLVSVMKDGLSPRGSSRGRLRAALVVSQVAVSLLLLVGAGLVARSLDAARRADAGFDARNVISVTIDLAANGYDETRGRLFYQRLLDALRADDGIESASLALAYPMTMVDPPGVKTAVEGYEPQRGEDLIFLSNVVASEYFRTLRIKLAAGREFDSRDALSTAQVAVVNETFARRFWGSPAAALAKRVRLETGDWRTIVGVARDVKYARINEDPRPYMYLPFPQAYQSSLILHTRGPAGPVALLEQARRHIQVLDPNVSVLNAKPLAEQTNAALTIFEMTAGMLFVFGGVAMGLAAMGIYGLVSYSVKQSTHDIGIRMALGARRAMVVWDFLGRGLRLAMIGAITGTTTALAVTWLLRKVLFGVSATDPASFAIASAIVFAASLTATLVPAWRAARTNPMVALRHQ